MAKKTSLRDFQEYLAGRLTTAAQGRSASSWLGVRAGEENWLIDLSDSGEIVQALKLTAVPLTRPWFAGIANIRGSLHAVADFSVFCGGAPTPRNNNTRLLLVGSKFGANAALLVTRMIGLRNIEALNCEAPDPMAPPWAPESYTDNEGRRWKKLKVRELLADETFMDIGV